MDDYLREVGGKSANDPCKDIDLEMGSWLCHSRCRTFRPGSGRLFEGKKGVPSLVLERSNWQLKTYDRFKLHLPKQFCELPLVNFPEDYPTCPAKQQFIQYLESYAKKFEIWPVFNQKVVSAEFDRP